MATLRLTDAEKSAIRTHAGAAKLSEKKWVKDAIRDYKRKLQGGQTR